MSTLPKITIQSAVLIALAACARPAYSGSASAGAATSAPAASTAPAGTSAPAAAAIRPSAQQSLARLQNSLAASPRAGAPILVIPAKEMAPETYDRIVEDLSVMSRILEKSVHDGSEETYGFAAGGLYATGDTYGHALFLPSDGAGPWILRPSGGRPKALYVGGYGAVFSLRVSFPLVPPPEAPKQDKAAEPTDQVWAAAQRELADPQAAARTRHAGPAGEPYRPETVDNLKNALTGALKHASNIRDLEPESWLTILVQGPATVPEQPQESLSNQLLSMTTYATGRTLLTLRVKKADIDQSTKGQLDETQFRQRVQIVTR